MGKLMQFFILEIILISLTRCGPVKLEKKHETSCGYESCHPIKEGYVNIHLIPHSHDDVGWVKTVDEFYYGTRQYLYRAGVKYIYDTVLQSVQKSKDRKFIYVETAFFWKWWLEQEERERNILKELVNNGQIEFIGGGWSMNDEAACNYQSIIDNMSWGLKILNDTLGECARPKMGWQIDPFGHSSEMASIFASLGYDGVILGRIDYQDQDVRLKNKSMEMVWRGSDNLGRSSDIFTSVLYDHYGAPDGFCFEVSCDNDFLVDDINSPEYNIDYKAKHFILDYVQDERFSFQTSNVIVPMGSDFAYQEAEAWFSNMDTLIKYINTKEIFNGTKYHILYSTPSCYAAAVHKESNGIITSALKTDDFMPYATDPHSFWTGFYTSRPTLKRFERMGNNFLQETFSREAINNFHMNMFGADGNPHVMTGIIDDFIIGSYFLPARLNGDSFLAKELNALLEDVPLQICKQLYALTDISSEHEPKLDSLREAMGVLQHHDAITGTEKKLVAYDYSRLLHIGIKNCENITNQGLSTLIKANNFETCLLLNVSQCAFSENADVFVVTIYNPLSRNVNKYIRLPVYGTSYLVTGPDGNTVRSQIIPVSRAVQNITGRESNATLELVFQARDVPPLGFKSFYVEKSVGNDVTMEDVGDSNHFSIDGSIGFDISTNTGFLKKISMDHYSLDVDQLFWFYNGSNGWDQPDDRPSGAYIFRPDSQYPISLVSNAARYEVYQGALVIEVQQTFNEFVSQTLRIYRDEKYVELDWVVGPIFMTDTWPSSNGKEVISRFSTSLKSDSTFYTDSNGRAMLERTRNFRPTWDITVNETESSNYYPVTSKIMIEDTDENLKFAVLTDRAQGGSSLEDGDVELMLLRNSVADDQLGVGEALQEEAFDSPIVVRGSHYVVIGPISSKTTSGSTTAAIQKEISERKLLDSWIFFSPPAENSFKEYSANHPMEFSGLTTPLPPNVHILTLEPWTENGFLLRIEHTFEVKEEPELSQPVSINLQGLFTTFEIISLRETTLGGNQWLEDNHRLNFASAYQSDGFQAEATSYQKEWAADLTIALQPMQIRTFVIEVEAKTSDLNLE